MMDRRGFMKLLAAATAAPVIGLPVVKAAPSWHWIDRSPAGGMGLYELMRQRQVAAMRNLEMQIHKRLWQPVLLAKSAWETGE